MLQGEKLTNKKNWSIENDYTFGGYAKIKPTLISFMNDFYQQYRIPLDPIYTGKMVFASICWKSCFLSDRTFTVDTMAAKASFARSVKAEVFHIGASGKLTSRATSPGLPAVTSSGNALFCV